MGGWAEDDCYSTFYLAEIAVWAAQRCLLNLAYCLIFSSNSSYLPMEFETYTIVNKIDLTVNTKSGSPIK